jgi:hypothetical protein
VAAQHMALKAAKASENNVAWQKGEKQQSGGIS